jgi:uncharacterized membrane protein YdjX (TVP38/TMEM64 family)
VPNISPAQTALDLPTAYPRSLRGWPAGSGPSTQSAALASRLVIDTIGSNPKQPAMFNLLNLSAASVARRLPLAIAVAAAIAFIAVGGSRYVNLTNVAANAQWLRGTAEQWGAAAPIIFIATDAMMSMVLVVPSWLCTMIGGLLFGQRLGAAYALAGTTLGATGVFMAARAGLTGLVERAGPRATSIVAGFRTHAFRYLIVLRLVPLFPFTLVNIAAALGGQSIRSYVLATLIGIIPSVVIYASLGDLLMDLARHGRLPDANLLYQPKFLLPLLGLAGIALLPLLAGSFRRWTR